VTPFDHLGGFERRIERASAAAAAGASGARSAARPGVAPSGAAARQLQESRLVESTARVAAKFRDIKATRHTTLLVDRSELPAPQRAARRIDEGFWRQSTAGDAPPLKKKRRRQTLPRQRAKRARLRHAGGVAAPGGGGRGVRSEGALGEGGVDSDNYEEEEEGGSGSDVEGVEGADGVVNLISDEDDDDETGALQDLAGEFDDADAALFAQRRGAYLRRRRGGGRGSRRGGIEGGRGSVEASDGEEEVLVEEEEEEDVVVFEGGLRIPADLYDRLFDYQKTGVKWLWELHTQRAGGIIGDEMGLGKTIQVGGLCCGDGLCMGWLGVAIRSRRSALASLLDAIVACIRKNDLKGGKASKMRCIQLAACLHSTLHTRTPAMYVPHTVQQIIVFLAGLHHSGLYRPTLVVCPATVLRQWLREVRAW
jgi:hypothetical protein